MKNRTKVLLFALLLSFSSCGLFKSTTKAETKYETKTSAKVDSVATVKTEVQDKTETVIKEKAQGVAYTKPTEVKVEADLTDLLAGMQVIRDSGLVKITQSYDSVKKVIITQAEVKPQPVAYDVDKTTVIKNDIKSQVDQATKVKKDTTATVLNTTKKTTSKPGVLIWVVTGLLIVALIVGVLYYKYKRGL